MSRFKQETKQEMIVNLLVKEINSLREECAIQRTFLIEVSEDIIENITSKHESQFIHKANEIKQFLNRTNKK